MEDYKKILKAVKKLVWQKLKNEPTGHDYWHCFRVAQNALLIGKKERANLKVLELAAWSHDIAANKDKNHEKRGAKAAQKFLSKLGVDEETTDKVANCIKKHRFSKRIKPKILEERIIQDADKLDALGAMGLAGAFILAGHYGQTTYNPKIKPDFAYYLKHGRSNTTINYFYDKVFKLKNCFIQKLLGKLQKKEKNL